MAAIIEYLDFLHCDSDSRYYETDENFYEGNEPLPHSMSFKTFRDMVTGRRKMDLRFKGEGDNFKRAWDNLEGTSILQASFENICCSDAYW